MIKRSICNAFLKRNCWHRINLHLFITCFVSFNLIPVFNYNTIFLKRFPYIVMSDCVEHSNITKKIATTAKIPSLESLGIKKVFQNSEEIYQTAKHLAQLKKKYFQLQKDSSVDFADPAVTEIIDVNDKLKNLEKDYLLKSVANNGIQDYCAHFESTELKAIGNSLLDREYNLSFSESEVKTVFNKFKDSYDDSLHEESLRFLLLNYVINENVIKFPDSLGEPKNIATFKSLILDNVLPFIRESLTHSNTGSATSSIYRVASNIQALISIYLFFWYDSKIDIEFESDVYLLFEIMENTKDIVTFQFSIAAVTLLAFHSENWFDSIDSNAMKLFEIYQNCTLEKKVFVGKALAFFYSIYDYSDQHVHPEKSGENSAPYTFKIPTIDNDRLFTELSQTVSDFKTNIQPGFMDDQSIEKIQASINASILLVNDSELLPTDYNQYEQKVLNKIKALDIGPRNDGNGCSWLQVLVNPVFTWLFGSHFDTEVQKNQLARNVYYSLSASSISTARTNQRLNLSRYTHFNDPKFIKSPHIHQE